MATFLHVSARSVQPDTMAPRRAILCLGAGLAALLLSSSWSNWQRRPSMTPIPQPQPHPNAPRHTAQKAPLFLRSRFARALGSNNGTAVPLPEYPRPHLQRAGWRSLNGWWQWQELRSRIPMGSVLSHRVRVPYAIESPLSGVGLGGAGAGISRMRYRRTFSLPAEWGWPERCGVRLHIGAVDWQAIVHVNGIQIGAHSGGFAPFSFAIDRGLRRAADGAASHVLEIEVHDPSETFGQPIGKQRSLSGGMFYTGVSGVWGTVWLERMPLIAAITHLQHTFELPARLFVDIEVRTTTATSLAHLSSSNCSVTVQLHAPSDATDTDPNADSPGNRAGWWSEARAPLVAAEGSCALPHPWRRTAPRNRLLDQEHRAAADDFQEMVARCRVTLTTRQAPRLWSPESPVLYGVVARLHDRSSATVLDSVRSYAGLRTVSLVRKDGVARLALNGKPRFLAGVLDQGYWPTGLYTPPADEAGAYDIAAAKRLGFDLIRKHAKLEAARWYYHADRLGMLVWQDMPPPPAVTCASAADGNPAWYKEDDEEQDTVPVGAAVVGGNETARRDKETPVKDGRLQCALDTRGFSLELREMVTSLFFSPSVVLWVIFNEAWGQHATARYVQMVRDLDATRLVTAASGWLLQGGWPRADAQPTVGSHSWLETATRKAVADCGSDCGDTIDVHAYPGPWPSLEHRQHWYGDGVWERLGWTTSAARASVLGEFGGARFELSGHTQGAQGWGYGGSKGDCAGFAAELFELWRQVANMSGLSAVVYTQLYDVEEEWNGLLTYDRVHKCEKELTTIVAPQIREVRRALT